MKLKKSLSANRWLDKRLNIARSAAQSGIPRGADNAAVRIHGQNIIEKNEAREQASLPPIWLMRTLENMTDGFYMLDREWRFIYINREAERILRRSSTELLGKIIWEEFKESVGTNLDQEFHRAVRENCAVAFEDYYAPLAKWGELRAFPSEEGLAVYFTDISGRKQSEMERDNLLKEKMLLLESTGEGIWGLDVEGLCTFINKAGARMLGYDAREVLGKNMHELVHYHHADGSPYPAAQCPVLCSIRTGQETHQNDNVFWRKDGTQLPVEYAAHPIHDAGKTTGSVVTFSDITERKRAEREIYRINRALQMLSRCNEALIRASDEKQLLAAICRLAVGIGGYRMAWVGFAQDDACRTILPMAYFGDDAGFLDAIRVSWSADQPTGRGPSGRTIRTNEVVVIPDLENDPWFQPWAASAREHGYRSVVSLPLHNGARTFGVLSLYGAEVAPVSADEVKLLQSLADDLAFGIGNMRSQHERQSLYSAVLKVAAGVSAVTGAAFFTELTRNMVEAVGGHAGFVARLLPGEPLVARSISVVIDGVVTDNFDFLMEGASCQALLQQTHGIMFGAVNGDYAGDCALLAPFSFLNAQAYIGARLDNSGGQPMGMLFVLSRRSLQQSGLATSVLKIFAARAGAELERQDADARIREQASILDKATNAIVVRGIDNMVQFWNKGAERLYGWTAEEAIGRSVEDLLFEDSTLFRKATRSVLKNGEWRGEITERRKDGNATIVEAHWTLVKDDDDRPQSILSIKTDITQRKAAEQKIQNLAFYDSLTGLPNRRLLMNRLQRAIAISARNRCTGALLFIDLDNFKTLNDTLGHDKGDLLLQQVAQRLRTCISGSDSDVVGRLGGDEFVIILEDLGDSSSEAASAAKAIGDKILAMFTQPYRLAGTMHFASPSIGIAPFSGHEADMAELLKRAEVAMYEAKAAGRNTLRFFDPGMHAAIAARRALEADFRQALEQNQFILHYQPQVDDGDRVTGAEALVRWQHPQRGLVSPAEFIPLAEETGLILPLGQWVLETACTQLAAWTARPETAQLNVAVNVSARQFRDPNFVQQVIAVLSHTGADPGRLKLELTESMLVDDVEATISKMTALKNVGVSFSLDDFGTGYSSLLYLKRLPLDQLKIDRSFVRDVLTDPNDAAIARTIVSLAGSLGLAVIAEGVETAGQRDFLARHGCHAYQGYFFSRPLVVDEFTAFADRRS